VLVIDEKVDIEDEDNDNQYNGDDYEREIEISHRALSSSRFESNRIERFVELGFGNSNGSVAILKRKEKKRQSKGRERERAKEVEVWLR
jgi:hypothetical protein